MSVRRGEGWQATVRGPDGREVTKTFPKKVQAEQWEAARRTTGSGHRSTRRPGATKPADWVVEYSEGYAQAGYNDGT